MNHCLLVSLLAVSRTVSIKKVLCMYPTHHEADEERFVDTVNHIFTKKHTKTYLQQIREELSMSIQELAEQAEIDAAALREMEKNFHTINIADAATVYRLSKILGCRMEDLMEI